MIDNIVSGFQDFVKEMWWMVIDALLDFIYGIFDALFNGVLAFAVFDNEYIQSAYVVCIAIFFLLVVPKSIYEIFSATLTQNDRELDLPKKLFNIVQAVLVIVSVKYLIPVLNVFTTKINHALINQDSTKEIGGTLAKTVFMTFGGLSEQKSNVLLGLTPSDVPNITGFNDANFYIAERVNDVHYFNFSDIMVIVGLLLFLILLIILLVQIATRICFIAFLFVITPLVWVTNTVVEGNKQAITVWKQTLIGQFLMNTTQIFLLMFVCKIIPSIEKSSSLVDESLIASSLTTIVLWIGSLALLYSVPPYVQAMCGGYGAGIMESLNGMKQGIGMTRAMTVGAVASGFAGVMGNKNNSTGYREGGVRGRVVGNKQQTNKGDIVQKGGLKGSLLGTTTTNAKGGKSHKGGVRGAIVGNRSYANAETLGFSNDQQTTRSGGLRGRVFGDTIRDNKGTYSNASNRKDSFITQQKKNATEIKNSLDIRRRF